MRKLYIVGLISLAAIIIGLAWAEDLTLTTYYPAPYGVYNRMVVMDRLGVGTTVPSERVDVVGGQVRVLDTDWNDTVQAARIEGWIRAGAPGLLVSSDTDHVFFGLRNEGANRKDAVIEWGDDPDEIGPAGAGVIDSLRFIHKRFDGSGGGEFERMRIDAAGNVGIGTNAPAYPLHVWNNNASLATYPTMMKLSAGPGPPGPAGGEEASLIVFSERGQGKTIVRAGANYNNSRGNSLVFDTHMAAPGDAWNTNQLVLHKNGNVGIGTDDEPQAALDVDGNVMIRGAGLEIGEFHLPAVHRIKWVEGPMGVLYRATVETDSFTVDGFKKDWPGEDKWWIWGIEREGDHFVIIRKNPGDPFPKAYLNMYPSGDTDIWGLLRHDHW